MRPYFCPTKVFTNLAYDNALGDLAAGRRVLLLTSAGWVKRGIVDKVGAQLPAEPILADSVSPNPKASEIIDIASSLADFEVIIALGGGSVLDAAKGIAAYRALDSDEGRLRANLIDGEPLPDVLDCVPIIAVPTTSGTGSEVTRWGTIWGRAKYSIAHPALYPEAALLDPRLCVSMPKDVTLCTGLDALSHAMEAVWNRHNTPASDCAAVAAIRTLKTALPAVMEDGADVDRRQAVQIAALYAGYAMGTTQTALAHSISYPFTMEFDLPHGFACSFTLGEVARYNAEADKGRIAIIADAFGCDVDALCDTLHAWMKAMGVQDILGNYVGPDAADRFSDDLINPGRAANNIRSADGADGKALVRASLSALL